jgi:transposase
METLDFRKLCPQAQEEIRKRAVGAVLSGRREADVAADFKVSRQAVSTWFSRYRKGGAPSLRAMRRGPRKCTRKLLPWQAAWTAKAIEEHYPNNMGLPYFLWSRKAIALLIETEFAIKLSMRTIGRYLQRWHFTSRVPVKRAYEQEPDEVKHWLHWNYPAIMRYVKQNHGMLFFSDAVGFRSYDTGGKSYGRCGKPPVIPSSGKRFGCNVISALDNSGHFSSTVFEENFKGTVLLGFFRQLLSRFKKMIYMIMDSHPVHNSGLVTEWLKKHADRIRVFFLPGYSPELNPDELFNNDIKNNAVRRCRPHTKTELIGQVKKLIRAIAHSKSTIKSYFQGKHVLYAAGSAIAGLP